MKSRPFIRRADGHVTIEAGVLVAHRYADGARGSFTCAMQAVEFLRGGEAP